LSTLLLDAGVWVAAVDEADSFHRASRAIVFDLHQPVAALDLTFYEVANAVGVNQGNAEKAAHLARLIAKRCRRGSVVAADPSLLHIAVSFATDHRLTAYDAAYVAAANSNGWTLVSADIADLVSQGLAVTPDAALYP
jgi:predicted nucleic acid-binding protein